MDANLSWDLRERSDEMSQSFFTNLGSGRAWQFPSGSYRGGGSASNGSDGSWRLEIAPNEPARFYRFWDAVRNANLP